MHDIKLIREEPAQFDAGLAKRSLEAQSGRLIDLDKKVREAKTRQQEAETERNTLSKQIGRAKAQGDEDEFNRLRGEVDRLKTVLEEASEEARHYGEALNQHLAALPNLPEDGVPQGADEANNAEVRRWGEPKSYDFKPRDHVDLGEGLGQMDFEKAAELSGSRFVALKGPLARLERALAQFMLDVHTTQHDYTEVSPPFLVRDEAMFGTGQLPKFAEDLFRTTDDRWLIPTAEVPLTNLARDTIHDETALPMRMTAFTPCFRAEAGSAGRDTRGMIRMHQFQKVEMVSIVAPEESETELDRMTGCAEKILQLLDLPYRVMLLCTGDMGFSAKRTYDLEVWLPSQDTYREISSCSNCGDFQARRMNARYRKEGEKRPAFLHTLNGSGVAVGRAMLAVMENHQNADGSITIPQALRPYMGGLDKIEV
ncbi:MAG: serine--tRNA ligase [Maricaulis sp.]|uniref:serine--tRNA ligase n=1 Tax=Maricaulis sp. TaxID=1486257 RepID=UPI001B0689F7|nr:serine--tRNA ligase [Maricaulis sp.]MBO6729369.1 serine--tRNA ligase [Maricaulis sp.]MBO6848230.1 serine--tRNA ligase [Maricaulis sp.]MBO6877955.1 serine--tRNA ligase [Maricaulis sp.]